MFKTIPAVYRSALVIFQILLILAVLPRSGPAQVQGASGDRVAVVNGEDIHKVEFEAALQQALSPWTAADEEVNAARLRALRKEVLDNLIGRRLAYQESVRLGIRVDSGQIDQKMKKAAARISTAVAFERALEQAELSRAELRTQFRQDIAIGLLIEEQVLQHVNVDDREVRAFYDSHPNLFKTPALVQASHIFAAAGPGSTREKRKEAVALLRTVQAQLDQGTAFSELAIDYSQCPSSENGGNLGYFDKEKMIKGFAAAAFSLNPGEVSDIVRTGQGYHLIAVTDRKPRSKLSFEDVKEQLRRNLKIEKATREIKAYLETLRETAEVKIFLHL